MQLIQISELDGQSSVNLLFCWILVSLSLSLTGSSADKCSEGDSFKLCAAQTMSRDFLSVSSVLQAVNKAAAVASCGQFSIWVVRLKTDQVNLLLRYTRCLHASNGTDDSSSQRYQMCERAYEIDEIFGSISDLCLVPSASGLRVDLQVQRSSY